MHAAVLLLALSGPGSPPAGATFPGGLLSTSGRAAYLGTEKGLVALDLTTGAVLWRSDLSHRPLFVAGDRLYSLALSGQNEARVVGHDLGQRGARAYRSSAVPLPRWAASAPGPGHTFSYTFHQQGQELLLEWHAAARPATGLAKEARGAARIDLRTGHVKDEKAGVPAAPAATPRVLEKLAVRWQRSLAGHLHALVLEEVSGAAEGGRQHRLVLRGWEERSGRPTLSRELMRGRDLEVLIGHGDRHLWLREATPSPGDTPEGARRFWSVFSGVDGRAVARVPVLPGTRQGLLLGGRAYCLTARSRPVPGGGARPRHELHAIDVETGKVAWTRALDDAK
jgi:hypothetical protein